MSRNGAVNPNTMAFTVTSREGRVSRNVTDFSKATRERVTSREGRVSRNQRRQDVGQLQRSRPARGV